MSENIETQANGATAHTKAILPLKTVMRGPVAGLLASFNAAVGAARGDTNIPTPKDMAKALPDSFEVIEAPRENPLNDALVQVGGAVLQFLHAYQALDPSFIIPRAPNSGGGSKGGPVGPRSILGKLVVPSGAASEKFVAAFGGSPRKVLEEGESELGESYVVLEGLGAARVSRSNVRVAD